MKKSYFKITLLLLTLTAPCPAAPQYTAEKIFTFGFWAAEPRQFSLEYESLAQDLVKLNMNCIVAGPPLGVYWQSGKPKDIEVFAKQIAICEKYGIYTIPFVRELPEEALIPYLERFKDSQTVLGWYIKDEPNPDYLPTFLSYKKTIEAIAPRQPAICLFYRPDSAVDFTPYQPLVLSDCYPTAWVHNGTSIGPHFMHKDGNLSLGHEMSRFNMYGNYGVLEWMDLIANYTEKPHWVTLQGFGSTEGRYVRWREPTAEEIRLHTYLAIAGGAKGINYFRYQCIADAYGNPIAGIHGQGTPMLDMLGQIGFEILPLGDLLIDADVSEPFTNLTTLRATEEPAMGLQIRRLASKTKKIDYLVVFNNDVLIQKTAQFNLRKNFVNERKLYDLKSMKEIQLEERPVKLVFNLELEPGEGRILALIKENEYPAIENGIYAKRCDLLEKPFKIDYDLVHLSEVSTKRADAAYESYKTARKSKDNQQAEFYIKKASFELQKDIASNEAFSRVANGIESIKKNLGRLASEGRTLNWSKKYEGPESKEVNTLYMECLKASRAGQWKSISNKIVELDQKVKELLFLKESGKLQ